MRTWPTTIQPPPPKRRNFRQKTFLPSVFLLSLLASCSSSPVVETVTTDAGRVSALPPGAQPIAVEPKLPTRDPDIETAGDRIAEAIVYLNTHRRDRRESVLRALNQAETAINHALRNGNQSDNLRNGLRTRLKELDLAEKAVQRNAPDAARQLSVLNKNLDGMNQ